jgi:hypothetical protein
LVEFFFLMRKKNDVGWMESVNKKYASHSLL